MTCKECGEPVEYKNAIEGLCVPCVTKGGHVTRLTPEDLKRLRRAVEAETAGLLSQELLLEILERMYDRLAKGEPFDATIKETAIELQRLAGLGMCGEMLKITTALGNMATEQEEEIRRKMRVLSGLGR